jgi:regulator of protease activity HflC (stomatin/prohibitin superfamily)
MRETTYETVNPKIAIISLLVISFLIFILILILNLFTTVPAGHVAVSSLFGKVKPYIYTEGFHLVNPFLSLTLFDARQKTHKESMGVPSKDQLITDFQLSIQYRLIKEVAPTMLKETGTPKEVLDVHMIPLLRSQIREIGKSVETAEMFYDQNIQKRIQEELLFSLSNLSKKGIKVEKLLIRKIVLPKIITDAVVRKKEASQEAEKAKEQLKKFKIDQERKETQAMAEKKAELIQAQKKKEVLLININAKFEAARIEAKSILVIAQAQAKAKKLLVKSLTLEGYVKLESMKALKELQNGNHIIILDKNSALPLPFLNLTEGLYKK